MDLSNVPEHTRAGLQAMNAAMPLVGLEPKALCQQIIDRYMDGESMVTIATSYGLKSTERLYQVLLEHAEEKWKQVTTARALSRHYKAVEALETAADGLALGRGREVARTAQWELERVCRRVYGADTPTINVQVNIGDVAGQIRELEGELLRNAAVLQANPEPEGDSE